MDINEGLQEKRLLHIQLMSLIWTEDICKLKGLLNILVLTSHHQYWHRHFKILSLPHENFLERDGLLFGISMVSLWYNYSFLSEFLFTYLKVSIGVPEKTVDHFRKPPSKIFMTESFWSTLEGFSVIFSKKLFQQLFWRELDRSVCFCRRTPQKTL